jgi:hypothetical protein
MLSLLLAIGGAAVAGGLAGAAVAWSLMRGVEPDQPPVADAPDEWISAEIDQAAATWAMKNDCPEAAPIMADKLRLLHRLGERRRAEQ